MGNVSYAPLIEDMTWSYSRITSFETCPYAWFQKYILDAAKQPNFYSSYGSLVHSILEAYYKGNVKRENLVLLFLTGFQNNVVRDGIPQSIVHNYMKQGVDYFTNFKPVKYDVVAVEKKVDFEIGGKHFVGFIDLLCHDGDGFVIVDHKSRTLKKPTRKKQGSAAQKEIDKYLRQLYLYSEAIRQECGETPKALCFNCFRNQNFIEEPFTEDAFEQTKSWAVGEIKSIETAEDFYPTLNFFYCKSLCEFRDNCCYYETEYGKR